MVATICKQLLVRLWLIVAIFMVREILSCQYYY